LLVSHVALSCLNKPMRCPNAGCSTTCARQELLRHRAACPQERVICAVPGCGKAYARSVMDAHLESAQAAHLTCLCAHVATLTQRLTDAEARAARVKAFARRLAATAATQGVRIDNLAARMQDLDGEEEPEAEEEEEEEEEVAEVEEEEEEEEEEE
jgi:hypothetical protein